MKKEPELTPTVIKGCVEVLRVLQYKNHPVYIRRIKETLFEYLLVHEGQIFSSYIIITPRKGKRKLNQSEINESAGLILTGAIATINTLLGVEVTKEEELLVEEFEKTNQKKELVEGKHGKEV